MFYCHFCEEGVNTDAKCECGYHICDTCKELHTTPISTKHTIEDHSLLEDTNHQNEERITSDWGDFLGKENDNRW